MIGHRVGWDSGLRERRDLKRREEGKRMDRGEGGREHGQKGRQGVREAEKRQRKRRKTGVSEMSPR